jgi:hypothetical protein
LDLGGSKYQKAVRNLYKEGLHNYSGSRIKGKMDGACTCIIAQMVKMGSVYIILVRYSERKRIVARLRNRWECKSKQDVLERANPLLFLL